MSNDVDAIVVGSGAGGSMVTLGLARAGRRVLVLERGKQLSRRDFIRDELHEDVRRYRPDPAKHPHTVRRTARDVAVRSDACWTATCVGGATVVYGGVSLRARPSDLSLRSRLGEIAGASLVDWPITYDELAPFYDEAEALLDVSGDVSTNPFEPPRQRALASPVVDAWAGPLIDRAAQSLGLHAYRTPLAVLSKARDDRAACTGCGFCARGGCLIGAKSSATEAIWPRALATNRVRIVPEAQATEVVLDARGRARAVRWVDAAGTHHEQSAKVVVLSCGAVESARLLLLSGFGRTHAELGKHVTFHHIVEAGGVLPQGSASPTHRAAPSLRALDDYYSLGAAAPLGGVLLLGDALGPIAFARAHAPFGSQHTQRMSGFPRHVRLFAIGQDLPREQNDVTLDPDVKDVFGLPVARITHDNHDIDRAAARLLGTRADELLAAAHASERWLDIPTNTTGDAHQHGTCRMGVDREHSVVDRDCAVHGVANLFVADGSFMPTALGVNPALTIQANALRVAQAIVDRGARGLL